MFLKLGRTWAWFHQHDILLSGFCCSYTYLPTILGSSNGKKSGHDAGNLGCIPGLRRFPGERHGNPLQYSCLENPHGQRILGGYSPWNHRVGHDWVTYTFTYIFTYSVQLLSCVRLFATHGLQHARLPCPSPIPGTCSNSCPSSRWCHPTISSSVVPFFSCPQAFPASGSFPVSQFFV